ncbi:MAG: hypothetical protein RSD05_02465, partial [Comamonas sp.]
MFLTAAETGFLSEGTAFFAGALRLTAAFLAGTALLDAALLGVLLLGAAFAAPDAAAFTGCTCATA